MNRQNAGKISIFLGLMLMISALPSATLAAVDLTKAARQIDLAVKKGLTKNKIKPNPKINDLTFLRRIYLDTIGRIPTLAEFEHFQNMRGRSRDAVIKELVNRPAYAGHQFNYWNNVLRARTRVDNRAGNGENYLNYLREAASRNMPYDKFVYNMLASNGNPHEPGNGAVGYYFRDRGMPLDNLSMTTQLFLGTDMSCAQCHDDPFSDWTQMDFYQLSAFTTGLNWEKTHKNKRAFRQSAGYQKIRANGQQGRFFLRLTDLHTFHLGGSGTGLARLPFNYQYDDGKPNSVVEARTLFGEQVKVNASAKSEKPVRPNKTHRYPIPGKEIGSRMQFAKWLTSSKNPMFTKTIVNRMWHKIMGATLVGPLNAIEEDDDGINPELTKVLIKLMKDVKYDLRQFEQAVFMSATYQSEMTISDIEGTDKYAFQGPIMTRLTATQLWDSLMVLKNENLDKGFKMYPVYDTRARVYAATKHKSVDQIMALIPDPAKLKDSKAIAYEYAKLGITPRPGKSADARSVMKKEVLHVSAAPKKNAKGKKGGVVDKKSKQTSGSGMMSGGGMMSMGMMGGGNAPQVDQFGRACFFPVPQRADHFLRQFGQSDRMMIDGDSTEASVPQALTIMNGIVEQIANDKAASVFKQVSQGKDEAAKIRIAYAMIMSRNAASYEIAQFKSLLKSNKGRIRDMIWVLLNSNEFKFRK